MDLALVADWPAATSLSEDVAPASDLPLAGALSLPAVVGGRIGAIPPPPRAPAPTRPFSLFLKSRVSREGPMLESLKDGTADCAVWSFDVGDCAGAVSVLAEAASVAISNCFCCFALLETAESFCDAAVIESLAGTSTLEAAEGTTSTLETACTCEAEWAVSAIASATSDFRLCFV